MLGEFVDDPEGLEGNSGLTKALGLLPIQTILKSPKTTTISEFTWAKAKGKGYEIHMGATKIIDGTPLLEINSRNSLSCTDSDGCLADNNQVAGTYIHGFFDSVEITQKWLHMIGAGSVSGLKDRGLEERNKQYDLLAEHLKKHIDTNYLKGLVL